MTDSDIINTQHPQRQIERLRAIIKRLRQPGGCPWDAEQTHQSLIPHLIEETFETVDAISREDWPHLREELGDVLLQIVLHAQIADEQNRYNLDHIALELNNKLIRRHPHVFASSPPDISDTQSHLAQWEQIKREEKGAQTKPYLHNTGNGLPGTLRAAKLQRKAAKAGFDWPDLDGVVDKILEELEEVRQTFTLPDHAPEVTDELGDLLFSVVNLCRKRNIDPEAALAATNRKFQQRFDQMEQLLKANGHTLGQTSLDTLETYWQQAKQTAP